MPFVIWVRTEACFTKHCVSYDVHNIRLSKVFLLIGSFLVIWYRATYCRPSWQKKSDDNTDAGGLLTCRPGETASISSSSSSELMRRAFRCRGCCSCCWSVSDSSWEGLSSGDEHCKSVYWDCMHEDIHR